MRDLPWRRTRDPWAVLVSEVMLQQTQVPRVVPIWHAFMRRFPTVRVCADTAQAEVVKAWAGLGYNRRAVNLHRAAVLMGGVVPSDLDALLALPGVGEYTARAVLVFAFEEDLGVVDTNIARVLSRRAGRPLTARELQRDADVLVPAGGSWEWNQRLMDLGALVCTALRPCLSTDAGSARAAAGPASSGRPKTLGRHGSSRRSWARTVKAGVDWSACSASAPCPCTISPR